MSTQRPWIAYVGPVAFPEGGAAARRILGNAKALAGAGYDVVIVSGQRPDERGAQFDVAPGIRCVSTNERDAEHLHKTLRYARYAIMGARSRQWLDAQETPPDAVILYSGYSPYLLQFTGWARRKGIALLFDAVEWYAAPSLPRFLTSPYLWNTEFAMRVLIPRLDGVVAISRALEGYYRAKGLPVGRVPPLFDPDEITARDPVPDPDGQLRLAYSGSPGRKDLIDIVIESVLERDAGRGRIVLDIAGVTEEELRRRPPLQRRGGTIPETLRAHGQVSHARSTEIVGGADFTVFLRAVNRVSTHGFPTKFVESLALGTPVITNLTSDLADHLRDGETGLECTEPTAPALGAVLDRALALGADARSTMRRAARTEAEKAFAYQAHVATLGELINTTSKNFDGKGIES
ncbi:glycosyltransferase family 4 protein [Shimia litoralis]|uniref:Glycosyltransferase family 4 protein n=1 Tax=Shimia litoralis TaxID=420403 RepID=A0A4U7MWV3_9RHOB|nr:glycosyltransferase [Shimia litoralis]TKZ17453.1 glycosyltransferase family 4 protein [Shimia litoralis]